MNVSELERHLVELRRMLEAAGVKGTVLTDLTAISEGFKPFRDYALSDFAQFLLRAEAFSRGEVPVIPAKKTPSPRKPKALPPDTATLAQEAKRLYDQASTPSVTAGMVEDLVSRVEKLTKDGMIAVALALDLKFAGSGPAKGKIAEQIKKRILDRKGSFQRTGLLDRETTAPPAIPEARP